MLRKRLNLWRSRRDIRGPVIRGRPIVARPTLGAWLAMAVAILVGYDSYMRNFNPEWFPPAIAPGSNMGANFRTYRYAAELALSGEPFYQVAPPGLDDWAVFLYPPITTLAYAPFTLVEWQTGYAILVVMNAVAGLLAAYLVVRFIDKAGNRLGWLDVGLIGSLFVISPFSFGTFYYGNVNLLMALAFVAGFLALERKQSRVAGILFGLTALWKLFPTILGVWLVRVRAWRDIASAVAVGLGGIVLGLLVFGWDRTSEFFLTVVFNRSETSDFVGGYPADGTYYITIQRPISQLLWTAWPGAPAGLLTILTLAVVCILLLAFYRDIEDRMERLFAIFATVIVAITIVPALQWYLVLLYFPMIPLLYLWDGPGRLGFIAGSVILFFNNRPGDILEWLDGTPIPAVIEPFVRDVFILATVQLHAMAIMLAACWWYRTRRRRDRSGSQIDENSNT